MTKYEELSRKLSESGFKEKPGGFKKNIKANCFPGSWRKVDQQIIFCDPTGQFWISTSELTSSFRDLMNKNGFPQLPTI